MTAKHSFPCPGCGADMVYEPGSTSMVCPYCGRREEIAAADGVVEERPLDEYLRPRADQLQVAAPGALEVPCSRCGAVVTFVPPEVAGECAFCGAQIVAQPKAADPMVAPEGVLPFGIPPEQARAAIKRWLATRWFAPNALKTMSRQESIGGVYLPFWTYDARTQSDYTGERGEYYYVTETYTDRDSQGNTVTRTRQVRHTRWYPASGRVARDFDDVLIAATKGLPRNYLDALEPWDLGAIRPYEPAFLSGFKAQRYQVELGEGLALAKEVMQRVIYDDVRRDIGGDEQRVGGVSTRYWDVTFKHLLLPVYLGAYRFDQKSYQVMVNARTGEVTGDRPYSWIKITLFVLFLLAVVATVVMLASRQ
jgi:DNA-directed RNA polymerase subunit RPC12/RpoP